MTENQWNVLTLAVRKQLGSDSDTEFAQTLKDVAEHGADTGMNGFCYFVDTVAFFNVHRLLIVEALNERIENGGGDPDSVDWVRRTYAPDFTHGDVLNALAGVTESEAHPIVANGLAWFALESVAYHFTESQDEVSA